MMLHFLLLGKSFRGMQLSDITWMWGTKNAYILL